MPATHRKKRPTAPPARRTTGPTLDAATDASVARDEDDANDWVSERLIRPDPADRQDTGIGQARDSELHRGRAVESKRGQQ